MAEHEVEAQVPADSIGVRSVARLNCTTAAATSADAEPTCNNTCERPMADYGKSAFYETFGFTKAERPNAAGTYLRG